MTGPLPSVLLVHNRYREAGGEDGVFAAESRLLRDRGHRVEELVFDNDDIPVSVGIRKAIELGAGTIWSRNSARRVARATRGFGADIVHFHNTFPLISPSAYSAARKQGAAVVQTLHNYRLLCANGVMYREGSLCERCSGHALPLAAVTNRCYRDSFAQSAVAAAMLTTHRLLGTWTRDVDTFVALTEFAAGRHVAGGLPANKIVIKPNFIDSPQRPPENARDGFLFVGRLVETKGIETLLSAWQRWDIPATLTVAGDGPLFPAASAAASERIAVPGRLSAEGVRAEMERAIALIVPSIWYEAFPLIVLEAYAAGLPVIASRIGSLAEVVEDGWTGLHFDPGDPAGLARVVRQALADRPAMARMGAAARAAYEAYYTPEASYAGLVRAYDAALASRRRSAVRA